MKGKIAYIFDQLLSLKTVSPMNKKNIELLNKERGGVNTKHIGLIIFLLIFGLIVLFLVRGFDVFCLLKIRIWGCSDGLKITTGKAVNSSPENIISPTPIPFENLTIPYLRSRSYAAELGKLEQVSAGNSYTSYSTYYLSDGLKINAQLTIPSGDMPLEGWSAIVFVHGYIPPSSYGTFKNYVDYVDYLANEGFVVFKIDLRGHGNSEGTAGGAYYSSDYIIDVLHAKHALQDSDFVNPQKIGLWGHSMAGNVVSRAMAVDTSIPAVVIWAGAVYTYSDMQKYGIQDNSYRPPADQSQRARQRALLFEEYGQFSPEHDFWKKVPMTNYLTDIKGAIQIHHAVDDDVVNIGYSRDFDLLLDDTAIIHELNEYPSGGHNITGASFSKAMGKTVDFYKKRL